MIQPAPVDRDQSIQALGFLMRGELAAAETYRHAIAALATHAASDLNRCMSSHDQRAARLADHISHAGGSLESLCGRLTSGRGTPDDGGINGRDSLLADLVEGERQGLSDYRMVMDQVNEAGVALMRGELLPEQVRTHGIVTRLCHRDGW